MNNDTCRCTASLCPIAETCARFVIPYDEFQTEVFGYADFSVHNPDTLYYPNAPYSCENFIPTERVE